MYIYYQFQKIFNNDTELRYACAQLLVKTVAFRRLDKYMLDLFFQHLKLQEVHIDYMSKLFCSVKWNHYSYNFFFENNYLKIDTREF
jgi:hypothetical protein